MALTMNPAVCSEWGWQKTVGAFVVGAWLGFMTMAAIIGTLYILLDQVAGYLAMMAVAWGVLRDLGLPLPMPHRRGQVPEEFRQMLPPTVVALSFGWILGMSFLTYYTYSVQLVALTLAPSSGLPLALSCASLFAGAKSLSLFATRGSLEFGHVASLFRSSRGSLRLMQVAMATTATTTLIALAGSG